MEYKYPRLSVEKGLDVVMFVVHVEFKRYRVFRAFKPGWLGKRRGRTWKDNIDAAHGQAIKYLEQVRAHLSERDNALETISWNDSR